HREGLFPDDRDGSPRVFGTGPEVRPKDTWLDIGRICHPAADAVCQPHLVAQSSAEPVVEPRSAPQDVIQDGQRFIIWIAPPDPKMSHDDMNLGPGANEPPDAELCLCRASTSRTTWQSRQPTPRRLPATEVAHHQRAQTPGIKLPGRDDERILRA